MPLVMNSVLLFTSIKKKEKKRKRNGLLLRGRAALACPPINLPQALSCWGLEAKLAFRGLEPGQLPFESEQPRFEYRKEPGLLRQTQGSVFSEFFQVLFRAEWSWT